MPSNGKPVAVQIGAGNIGRGFMGELFWRGGYRTVFADVDRAVVDAADDTLPAPNARNQSRRLEFLEVMRHRWRPDVDVVPEFADGSADIVAGWTTPRPACRAARREVEKDAQARRVCERFEHRGGTTEIGCSGW